MLYNLRKVVKGHPVLGRELDQAAQLLFKGDGQGRGEGSGIDREATKWEDLTTEESCTDES